MLQKETIQPITFLLALWFSRTRLFPASCFPEALHSLTCIRTCIIAHLWSLYHVPTGIIYSIQLIPRECANFTQLPRSWLNCCICAVQLIHLAHIYLLTKITKSHYEFIDPIWSFVFRLFCTLGCDPDEPIINIIFLVCFVLNFICHCSIQMILYFF